MFNKNITFLSISNCLQRLLFALFLLCFLNPSMANEEPNISIKTATLSAQDQIHLLNANINYRLSSEATEALHNGVTLTFNVDLATIEPRNWLWNKHLSTVTLPYQIKYHTLAETYQVSDKTNNSQHNFSTLSAALRSLGTLTDISLHSITTTGNSDIKASLKAYLNIEALPLPMRPLAYVTAGWYLRSNTYQWPLTP
ncbi:MAG: hypothetical protein A6F70_03470 [Cycloclasticus sp. symbiont of Bathymodiolus heckerae]|nr:MAG: hypothetical protein A6F70_03470 [Cycloclasticus sp. symbiont of Bathymodiolus heckerae]